MTSDYQIRPITAGEIAAFRDTHEHAFHQAPLPERRLAAMNARMELDRTLAAFEGATIVGKAGSHSFRLSVPGAVLAAAGVSMVAVLPTHRRRGILSALMRRQLTDVRGRGEAVAALFASEAGIYGRFGYGRASWQASYHLRGGEGALAPGVAADPGLRLRIAGPHAVRPELARVYDAVLAGRPGFYSRNDAWWDRVLGDPAEPPGDVTPLRCLLAEDGGGPRGYALYRGEERWDGDAFLPDSSMEIREVMAVSPPATAALWGDLLSRDLVTRFHAEMRPVDDPLLHLLADPRRVRARVSDGLWIRLVDVPAALALRRYACPVDVVIEVTDGFCPWNAGRWRLVAQPSGGQPGLAGSCERTSAPADLALPAALLGAAYLGGSRLGPMAAAGLITEHRPGAMAALSTAMSWDPAPWCPLIF